MARLPRDTTKIAENQVRQWQRDVKRRKELRADARGTGPIIAFSRSCGSLGGSIGQRVAELISASFWDHELVEEIIRKTGMERELVESLDEKTRSRLDEFLSAVLVGPDRTAGEVSRQTFRVIRTLYSNGNAVVVGRGAPFLMSAEDGLRVRVFAPFEKRVENMMKLDGHSQKETDAYVRQTDRDRENFYRHYFGVDFADPSHYDLLLNSGNMSVDGAAEVVVAAYEARFGPVDRAAAKLD